MSLEAAEKDFESKDDYFYTNLYSNADKGPIASRFNRPFMKSTWFASVLEKINVTSLTNDEVTYRVNPVYDFLLYSYMRFEFPRVESTSEKYQICWSNEPTTSMIVKASLRQDNLIIQEIDEYTINIFNQFFQLEGAGKREMVRKQAGDTEEVTGWTRVLETHKFNVEHPWYYVQDHALAYPLLYNDKEARTEHRYNFRRKLSELLRVRELQSDGKWRVVRLEQKHITVPLDTLIPIPELWGKYSIITDMEANELKSDCRQDYRNFWVKDFLQCDQNDTVSFGKIVKSEIQCELPCLALFWSAENRNSKFLNNHSNYTEDSENPTTGFDPVIKCKLKYGNVDRIVDSDIDHFTISQVRHHTASAPYKNGYHIYPFSWYPFSNQADIAIIFNSELKVSLECLINERDTNEEKTEIASLSAGRDTTRFKMKVRLMVYKKLSIFKDTKSNRWIFEINKK